jgi:hypothetical protein
MSAVTSDNIKLFVSTLGVDLAELNSTDRLAELVIDTFDQWSNPTDMFAGPTAVTGCGRDFDVAEVLV